MPDDNELLPSPIPEDADCFDITPEMALGDAIRRYRSGELKGSAVLIIHLDKGDIGDLPEDGPPNRYTINHNTAGMRNSDCIALMRVMEFKLLDQMYQPVRPSPPEKPEEDDGDGWKKDS